MAELSAAHRRELEEGSGISPEIIAEMGAWTATTKAELTGIGFGQAAIKPPALVFRVLTWAGGSEPACHRIKPDAPRLDAKGKPRKYEQPAGQGCRVCCLPSARRLIEGLQGVADRPAPALPCVFVTEGEKKAAALVSRGLAALALPGVWNFKNLDALRGDWDVIGLKSLKVCIVFDSDAATNPHVRKAEDRLAEVLRAMGAEAFICRLPARPNGEKTGADDFFVRGGTVEELESLIEEHRPYGGLGLVSLADVEEEQLEWLWKPYLPLGKLAMLAGRQGEGKSWTACAIVAAVSVGRGLLGMEPQPPADAFILTAEDGMGDTLRPRLQRMDADLTRIHVREGLLTLNAEGMVMLEYEVRRLRPKLIVIDPIQAFLGAQVDANRANEVRPLLTSLIEMASEHHLTVLIVAHTRKAARDGHAVHSVLGTTDFTAAVRSLLLQGVDAAASRPNEDVTVGGIVHAKSNLAAKGGPIGFCVEQGVYRWTGPCDMSEEDVLAGTGTGQSCLTRAEEFLREELADGPVDQTVVKRDAEVSGLSWATVRRAKRSLGVRSQRTNVGKGERGSGKWVWELPQVAQEVQDAQGVQYGQNEHIERSQVQNGSTTHTDEHTVERLESPQPGDGDAAVRGRRKTVFAEPDLTLFDMPKDPSGTSAPAPAGRGETRRIEL